MTEDGKKRLAFILTLAVLFAGASFYFYNQKSHVTETTAVIPAVPNSGAVTAKTDTGEIVVYISGAVNKPGVLRVPAGSRVVDVVAAAGGLAPGADPAKVNLAKVVKDGMQVNVPGGTTPAGSGAGSASHGGSSNVSSSNGSYNGEKISINYASKAELDKLPGIGPALAEKIVEYRQANGNFRDISELKKVPGVSEAKFNGLKEKIAL
jgi:competence protein ComEA